MSQTSLQRYKVNVIRPILANVGTEKRISIKKNGTFESVEPLVSDSRAVAKEIRDAPIASLFRRRVESLYGDLQQVFDQAKTAVRVVTDKNGNDVVVGADLSVVAPLANQLHKNLEMLGRATGELEPQGGGSVSIQILCPAAGTSVDQMPRITFSSTDAIEGTAEATGELEESEDIGVLQGQ